VLLRRALRGLWCVGLIAMLGCAEDSLSGPQRPELPADDAPGGLDAGISDHTACTPNLASIQSAIFSTQCATAGCHFGKTAAAALDLSRSDVGSLLISQAASSCANQLLVVPGKPDSSLLLLKMNGHVPVGCGEPMPPASAAMSGDRLECVRSWIAGLSVAADADAGAGSIDAAVDAGGCQSCGTASCLDVSADPQHCGACNVSCPTGTTCGGGTCQCPTGLALCNGACVDLKADTKHCGSCTTTCGAGSTCNAGACVCGTGFTSCNGACVEVATDPNNCQGCNIKCTSTQLCTPSGCSSTASCGSLTKCGTACVDTTASLSNCGGCGIACAGGQSCQAGTCVCPSGGTLCSGACSDTRTSQLNCGACGRACPTGTTCSSGACACDSGKTLCGSTCIDTNADANNCGGCGIVCGAGKACTQGVCACAGGPVGFASVSSILVDNCTNSGCHAGTVPKEGLNLTAAKAYAELVNVKAAQCTDGRMLVPSTGTGKSYLLQKLTGQGLCSGTQMPKAGSSISSSEIALIEAWICNGAKP
jgi:hypothetical protein